MLPSLTHNRAYLIDELNNTHAREFIRGEIRKKKHYFERDVYYSISKDACEPMYRISAHSMGQSAFSERHYPSMIEAYNAAKEEVKTQLWLKHFEVSIRLLTEILSQSRKRCVERKKEKQPPTLVVVVVVQKTTRSHYCYRLGN